MVLKPRIGVAQISIPMILYRIAWHFMWFGGSRRRERGGANTMLIGLAAFLFYFITKLLVLYA